MCMCICIYQNIQFWFFFHFFKYFHGLVLNLCNREGLVDLFNLHWLSKIYHMICFSKKASRTLKVKNLLASTTHCQNTSRQKHTSTMKTIGHKPGHWARTTCKEEDAWGDINIATTLVVCWELLQKVKCIHRLWSQHSHAPKWTC